MKSLNLLVFLFVLKLASSNELNPGLRVAVSNDALTKVQEHYLPSIISKLKEIPIQDIHFAEHIDFVGNVSLDLTEMKLSIEDISPEQLTVTFNSEEKLILINLKSTSAKIQFHYALKSGFYNKDSNGTIKISNLGLEIPTTTYMLENRLNPKKFGPGLKIKDIVLSDFDIDIEFQDLGGLEKIIKFFIGNLSGVIKQIVEAVYKTQIIEGVNSAIEMGLGSIGLVQPIPGTDLTVDYSITEEPQLLMDSLEMSFTAQIWVSGRRSNSTGSELPHTDAKTGATVYLNHNLLDDLLYGLYKEELLNATIYYETLMDPKTKTSRLNTTTFNTYLIQMKKYYKDELPCDLKCGANSIPVIGITEGEVKTGLEMDCTLIVRVNSTYNESAFSGIFGLSGDADFKVEKGVLLGKLKDLSLDKAQIYQTNIGEIPTATLKFIFNLLEPVIISQINSAYLKEGIKLPTIGDISLEGTNAEMHKGYAKAHVDPVFTKTEISESNSEVVQEEVKEELNFLS